MSVAPAAEPPTREALESCPNCEAALAPDQRYCLTCGEPVSPTRLSFLDALQGGYTARQAPAGGSPADRMAGAEQGGASGPLRQYAGLLGLIAVLLLGVVVGLLVGHWTTQAGKPAKQVITVEVPAAVAPSTPSGSVPGTSTSKGNAGANGSAAAQGDNGSSSSAGKANSAKTTPASKATSTHNATSGSEAAKTKPAEAKTVTPTSHAPARLSKQTQETLAHSTGKKYEEEINKVVSSGQPIETG